MTDTLTSVTLLDTVTGQTVVVTDQPSVFQWEDNNWSCDCSRGPYFGLDYPSCQALRFLVISTEPPLPGVDLNSDYPDELKKKYLTK